MTLSNIDKLSQDEAHQLSHQEVDPIDEEVKTPVPVSKAPVRASTPNPHDPLIDKSPFGIKPVTSPVTETLASEEDTLLFDVLWPLENIVKLDATVDRRLLRQQRDRLDARG